MPNMNQAGPQGAGPMTGRGMGSCNEENANASLTTNRMGKGRENNRRRGKGLGAGRFYKTAELTLDQQKDMLNKQKAFYESKLASIDEQIKKL